MEPTRIMKQPRMAMFERFTIELELEDALYCSQQGACDGYVSDALDEPYIAEQFEEIDKNDIRAELKEYGAWNKGELTNNMENRARILWIAAGNIREEEK